MSCTRCAGTGSLSRDLDGMLDCCSCETAVERAGFNAWVRTELPGVELVDAWKIYQRGKESK